MIGIMNLKIKMNTRSRNHSHHLEIKFSHNYPPDKIADVESRQIRETKHSQVLDVL